jgi:hypothetical protein
MQTSARYRAIRSGRLSRRRRLEAPLIGSEWSEIRTIFPQHPFASSGFVPPQERLMPRAERPNFLEPDFGTTVAGSDIHRYQTMRSNGRQEVPGALIAKRPPNFVVS